MATTRVPVNPTIIRSIRDRYQLGDEEIARLAGVKRVEDVADWESGSRSPTLRQAEALVEKLGLSILDLFTDHLPDDVVGTVSDYRSASDEETLKRHVALQDAAFLQEQYLLLAGKEIDPVDERLPHAAKLTDLRRLIPEVRDLLGVSLEKQFSWRDAQTARSAWREALELFGFLVFHVRHTPIEAFRAFSLYDPIAPLIAVNSADGASAHIFSYFHELGHSLLRHGGTCDSFSAPSGAPRVEASCNRFAAEFLVPKSSLIQEARANLDPDRLETSVASLSQRFSVSRQVVTLRLGQVGLLEQNDVSYLFEKFGLRQFIRKDELSRESNPIKYEYQLRSMYGARFLDGVISGIDSGHISLTDGLDLIQTNTTYLSKLREVV